VYLVHVYFFVFLAAKFICYPLKAVLVGCFLAKEGRQVPVDDPDTHKKEPCFASKRPIAPSFLAGVSNKWLFLPLFTLRYRCITS
jgi:hypothetical protein